METNTNTLQQEKIKKIVLTITGSIVLFIFIYIGYLYNSKPLVFAASDSVESGMIVNLKRYLTANNDNKSLGVKSSLPFLIDINKSLGGIHINIPIDLNKVLYDQIVIEYDKEKHTYKMTYANDYFEMKLLKPELLKKYENDINNIFIREMSKVILSWIRPENAYEDITFDGTILYSTTQTEIFRYKINNETFTNKIELNRHLYENYIKHKSDFTVRSVEIEKLLDQCRYNLAEKRSIEFIEENKNEDNLKPYTYLIQSLKIKFNKQKLIEYFDKNYKSELEEKEYKALKYYMDYLYNDSYQNIKEIYEDKKNPYAYLRYLNQLININLFNEAKSLINESKDVLIENKGEEAFFSYLQGVLSYFTEDYEKAEEFLLKAVVLNPKYYDANKFLYLTYQKIDDKDESNGDKIKTKKLDIFKSKLLDLYDNESWIYILFNDVSPNIKYSKKLVTLFPKEPHLKFNYLLDNQNMTYKEKKESLIKDENNEYICLQNIQIKAIDKILNGEIDKSKRILENILIIYPNHYETLKRLINLTLIREEKKSMLNYSIGLINIHFNQESNLKLLNAYYVNGKKKEALAYLNIAKIFFPNYEKDKLKIYEKDLNREKFTSTSEENKKLITARAILSSQIYNKVFATNYNPIDTLVISYEVFMELLPEEIVEILKLYFKEKNYEEAKQRVNSLSKLNKNLQNEMIFYYHGIGVEKNMDIVNHYLTKLKKSLNNSLLDEYNLLLMVDLMKNYFEKGKIIFDEIEGNETIKNIAIKEVGISGKLIMQNYSKKIGNLKDYEFYRDLLIEKAKYIPSIYKKLTDLSITNKKEVYLRTLNLFLDETAYKILKEPLLKEINTCIKSNGLKVCHNKLANFYTRYDLIKYDLINRRFMKNRYKAQIEKNLNVKNDTEINSPNLLIEEFINEILPVVDNTKEDEIKLNTIYFTYSFERYDYGLIIYNQTFNTKKKKEEYLPLYLALNIQDYLKNPKKVRRINEASLLKNLDKIKNYENSSELYYQIKYQIYKNNLFGIESNIKDFENEIVNQGYKLKDIKRINIKKWISPYIKIGTPWDFNELI